MGCSKGSSYLVLENQDTGKTYTKIELGDDSEFSIGFIHSINKSPLKETYQAKNKKIHPVSISFSSFGAGMQTLVEEGQELSYTSDGQMIITGFNTVLNELNYIVGTVYDHILYVNDEEISLTEICGRNAHVRFYIK